MVPDTPVPGLVPPRNTVLSCFTPCGRFLIAFQPISSEVVAFRFKGLHISTSLVPPPAAAPALVPDAAGAAAVAGAGGGLAQGPLQAQQQPPQQPPPQPQQQPLQQAQQQPLPQAQQGGGVSFWDMFEEHWRCCPCPSRSEQISTDLCMGG